MLEDLILKSLISPKNPEFFTKIMPLLEKRYFDPKNQEIFGKIKDFYLKYNKKPNITELGAILNTKDKEISEKLQKLATLECTENLDFLLDQSLEFCKNALYLEALILGSEGLAENSEKKKLKAQELLDLRAKLSIDHELGLSFDDVDANVSYFSETETGILTNNKELNKRLGKGFLPKTLSIILAPPGVGKSLLMCDLISGMLKQKLKILLISLEMSDKEIMKRIYSNVLNIKMQDLETKGDEIRQKMKETQFGELWIKDYSAQTFGSLALEALVHDFKVQKNVEFDIIFIDYLGIMKSDLVPPTVGLYSYIKSIGEELRGKAKTLNIPIVTASQLQRAAVNQDKADNANVADSLGSVMTADFMLFLLQTEEMKANSEMTFKVTKNRFTGITDSWKQEVSYDYMRFESSTDLRQFFTKKEDLEFIKNIKKITDLI